MTVGRENPHNRYNISKVTLNRSECERDLDVQVSSDLRPRKQCIEARNRANRVLGFIVLTSSTSASVNLRWLVQDRGNKPSLVHLVPPPPLALSADQS